MSDSIVERNILTIIEPAIELDPLEILDIESDSEHPREGSEIHQRELEQFSDSTCVARRTVQKG